MFGGMKCLTDLPTLVLVTLVIITAWHISPVLSFTLAPRNGWGPWSSGTCSVTCGTGTIILTRECNCSPFRRWLDECRCLGPSSKVILCDKGCCQVDGGWSEWEHGPCSKTCGGGQMSITRKCNNPKPSCGGNNCVGPDILPLDVPCNNACCPIDGGWSGWMDMSDCSVTCGNGNKLQIRNCTNPPSSCGGVHCIGKDIQVVPCNVNSCCPVNGNWGEWRRGSCSYGIQKYTRSCDNPKPSCGGGKCEGSRSDYYKQSCNITCTPVDGGWSEWLYGNCSSSCVKNRTRNCDNPAPSCGGKNCSGPAVETLDCEELPCEGGWGNWSDCSVTCGNGTRLRIKIRNCIGECRDKLIDAQHKACYMGCCPVDGRWSQWIEQPCSRTCGGGTRILTRECNNPRPLCGGNYCKGNNYFVHQCNDFCCPVDGGWSDWSVGSCSATCGGGFKEKFRVCDNPTPSCGGKMCSGLNVETEECNEFPCE